MEEAIDYRTHYLRLKNQNQLLRLELEEFEGREKNLKKQIQIMMLQVRQTPTPHSTIINQQMLVNEIQQLKQQLICVYKQREQLQEMNLNNVQKINDLKYNNGELKKLNQKIAQLHQKEIDMIRKERGFVQNPQEKERKLQKEVQNLTHKLESCADITKEMENYYMSDIRKLKDTISNQEQTIHSLSRELQQAKTHRSSQPTAKLTDSLKQNNDKWERAFTEMKEQYQSQIKQLKNKIRFLVNKLESIQQCQAKPSIGNITNEALVQSKMIQSNSSIDSFRFTPNSSVSSNKECIQPPSRRNTSSLKNQQRGKAFVPLAQRN